MAVLANASHAVTDFNDAPIVDIFIQNNESLIQIFNSDDERYATDDWSDAQALVLTPFVTVSGKVGNQVLSTTDGVIDSVTWYYIDVGGVRRQINQVDGAGVATQVVAGDFTAADGGVDGTARTLTVMRNIVGSTRPGVPNTLLQSAGVINGGTVSLIVEVVWADPVFGNITRERTVTLMGTNQAGSSFLCILEASNQFFSAVQTSNIVLTGRLFLGGNEITDQISAGVPTSEDGWVFDERGVDPPVPGTQMNNVLTLAPADVLGEATFRVTATYEGVAYTSNSVSIQDVADEWRIQGPGQVTLRNDQTAGQGNYVIYRNGVEYQGTPSFVGYYVDFRKFTSTASAEVPTAWDRTQMGTDRVVTAGAEYLTVSYLLTDESGMATTDDNAIVMRLTFGAGVTSQAATDPARFQVIYLVSREWVQRKLRRY